MFLKSKNSIPVPISNVVRYRAGQVLPVLSAGELLGMVRHQNLLNELKALSCLSDENFGKLYLELINRFAEFVQVIPSQPQGTLSGLLNEGLARGLYVLQQFSAHGESSSDPLLLYAVFSAGLLLDANKIIVNYKITLNDEQGDFIDHWYPLELSMCALGSFYKIHDLAPLYQRIDKSLTMLLARQLMPELGYMWLSSDMEVYADWLEALTGSAHSGGVLSLLLELTKREDWLGLLESLDQVPIEGLTVVTDEYGAAFLHWLRESIAKGDLKANNGTSGVFVVSEGVFLEEKIFKQFVEVYNAPVNATVVYQQVGNLLGLSKLSGQDYKNAQYFSESGSAFARSLGAQKVMHTGVLITEKAMVFSDAKHIPTAAALKSVQTAEKGHRSPPVRESRSPSITFSGRKK